MTDVIFGFAFPISVKYLIKKYFFSVNFVVFIVSFLFLIPSL